MPCASLLIRIVQAACHPNGRPKEVSGHSLHPHVLCLNLLICTPVVMHDSALLDKCKSCVRYVQLIAYFVCLFRFLVLAAVKRSLQLGAFFFSLSFLSLCSSNSCQT